MSFAPFSVSLFSFLSFPLFLSLSPPPPSHPPAHSNARTHTPPHPPHPTLPYSTDTFVILKIDDIQTRKTAIHAVRKSAIINKELGGIEAPISQLFQTSAPFCDLDLTPKFDYDLEKAEMLNCPAPTTATAGNFFGLFVGAAIVVSLLLVFIAFMAEREKSGEPLFTPLVSSDEVHPNAKQQP